MVADARVSRSECLAQYLAQQAARWAARGRRNDARQEYAGTADLAHQKKNIRTRPKTFKAHLGKTPKNKIENMFFIPEANLYSV